MTHTCCSIFVCPFPHSSTNNTTQGNNTTSHKTLSTPSHPPQRYAHPPTQTHTSRGEGRDPPPPRLSPVRLAVLLEGHRCRAAASHHCGTGTQGGSQWCCTECRLRGRPAHYPAGSSRPCRYPQKCRQSRWDNRTAHAARPRCTCYPHTRRYLQTALQHALLPLARDVLRPAHEAAHIALRRQVVPDGEVLRARHQQRVLLALILLRPLLRHRLGLPHCCCLCFLVIPAVWGGADIAYWVGATHRQAEAGGHTSSTTRGIIRWEGAVRYGLTSPLLSHPITQLRGLPPPHLQNKASSLSQAVRPHHTPFVCGEAPLSPAHPADPHPTPATG